MPVQIYILPQIGDGCASMPDDLSYRCNPANWTPTTGPYRTILHSEVGQEAGEFYDEMDNPALRQSIICVRASNVRLSAFELDDRIVSMVPSVAADESAMQGLLDTTVTSFPLAWRTAALAKLEGWSVNTDWITASTTLRQVIRAVLKEHALAQKTKHPDAWEFLKAHLDTTIAEIPLAYRTRIANWMTNNGLDTSWITGTTTVRDVKRYIAVTLDFGKYRFAGGTF